MIINSGNRNKKALPSQNVTFIAASVTIEGKIRTSNMVNVEGRVNGDIESEEGAPSSIVVGKNGVIKGNMRAASLSISGRVEGMIYAEEHLEIYSTATIVGDVHYRRLEMKEGARIDGKLISLSDTLNENKSAKTAENNLNAIVADQHDVVPEGPAVKAPKRKD